MPFCGKCGHEHTTEVVFCGECGAPTGVEESSPRPSEPPTTVPRRRRVLVILGIVLLILVSCCGVAWAVLGVTGIEIEGFSFGSDDEPTPAVAPPRSPETPEPSEAATSEAEAQVSSDPDIALLQEHYRKLMAWHERVGKPDANNTAGGTGFYYEVFVPGIGVGDELERRRLKERCAALITELGNDHEALGLATLDVSHDEKRAALSSLYDWQVARVRAMYEASMVALDDPAGNAWESALEPAFTTARDTFMREYPGANPAVDRVEP